MTLLTGRRILLIGIGFYDYEAAIAAELRALGSSVWVENQRPPAASRWPLPERRSTPAALAAHQRMLLERARALGRLDHVVVIKGDLLGDDFVKSLRAAQPTAQFIAYHWDSMARYPELVARQAAYDRVLTFDHADAAANPAFLLRPLFFRPELAAAGAAAPRDDLCFVGWLHHDRLAQIAAIERRAQTSGLSSFIYLSTGWRTKLRLQLRGCGRHVHARPIAFPAYANATTGARAIVDLPHPHQTGLTMRAVEALGAGRRLLTTGRDVAHYDFFAAGNVDVLDPDDPVIDPDFVRAPVSPLPADIVERYTLRRWATDVLGETQPGDFHVRAANTGLAA